MEDIIYMNEMAYYIGTNQSEVDSWLQEYLQHYEGNIDGITMFYYLIKYMYNKYCKCENESIYSYINTFTKEDFNKFIEMIEFIEIIQIK